MKTEKTPNPFIPNERIYTKLFIPSEKNKGGFYKLALSYGEAIFEDNLSVSKGA